MPETLEPKIPSQYEGLDPEVLEEVWQVPTFVDPVKNEQVQRERREALDALKAKVAAKDKADLARVTAEIDAMSGAKTEKAPGQLAYDNLANVQVGQERLAKALNDPRASLDIFKNIIYETLTTRSEFARMVREKGGDIGAILNEQDAQRKDYNIRLRPALEAALQASGEFKLSDNPGWFGVNTRPEAGRRDEQMDTKVYATIPVDQYDFIEKIPQLAKKLRELSLSTDDIIHVKVPERYAGFISKNDSVVIHFKKSENAEKIQSILQEWMRSSGITEEAREMDRIKVAADGRRFEGDGRGSFSDLVARNAAEYAFKYRGKYDAGALATAALNYAIETSKRSPTVRPA